MKSILISFLVLTVLLLCSCSKDVSLEPEPSASIIWKDTTTDFLNPACEFFRFTSSGPLFYRQTAMKPPREALIITYVTKPTISMRYDLFLYNSPVIIYYDRNQEEWESRTGLIDVIVNGKTLTGKFVNASFHCQTSVKSDVIASGHIICK